MNLFWYIYLIGFGVSLFYVTHEFIRWCVKHKINYREALNDNEVLFRIIIDSLGSWVTVLFYYISRDSD